MYYYQSWHAQGLETSGLVTFFRKLLTESDKFFYSSFNGVDIECIRNRVVKPDGVVKLREYFNYVGIPPKAFGTNWESSSSFRKCCV